MEKKCLKTGMIVEYRDGKLRLVVGNKLYDEDGCFVHTLEEYDEYLSYKYNKDLDIVAVYNDFDKSRTLWKRSNRKQEIISQLKSIKYNSMSNIDMDDDDEDDIWKKDVDVLDEVIAFIMNNYRD